MLGVFSNNKCCNIHENNYKDNRFFGETFVDGVYTSSKDKISGENVGVASIAITTDTIVTLVNDKITG